MNHATSQEAMVAPLEPLKANSYWNVLCLLETAWLKTRYSPYRVDESSESFGGPVLEIDRPPEHFTDKPTLAFVSRRISLCPAGSERPTSHHFQTKSKSVIKSVPRNNQHLYLKTIIFYIFNGRAPWQVCQR
jgi:hypothetical protein